MKTKLSALLDGELVEGEAEQLFKSREADGYLRDCMTYPLIGDVLRGERYLSVDITGAVMRQLEREPVVVAPRRRISRFHRPALALAASLAGVGVVAWLALGQVQPLNQIQPQPVAGAIAGAAVAPDIRPLPSADMQEYVISHQAQSSGLRLQGGAEHIRTVSLGHAK